MASATGPDLDGARVAVENLMDDACVVTLDPEGMQDDTLDETTGYLIETPPDAMTLYSQATVGFGNRPLADTEYTGGKCKVKPASQTEVARYVDEGGVTEHQAWYILGLPWDAPILPLNSVASITTSRRDPALVTKPLIVRAAHNVGTMLVVRRYMCEVRTA